MDKLAVRYAMAILFAVFADVLLYGVSPGLGLTIFALLVSVLAAVTYGSRLKHAGIWPIVWLIIALGAALEASLIGRILLVVLGWAILALTLMPEPRSLFSGLVRGTTGGARSIARAPGDARRFVLLKERRLVSRKHLRMPAWVYAIPIALIVLFAGLIVPANLILARWAENLFDWVVNIFPNITIDRIVFWGMVFLGVYGVLRFRLGRRGSERTEVKSAVSADEHQKNNELRACLLTFAGLNLLYLAANAADAIYLWFEAKLPSGMTYAQFAHQGSYRLIVAVVLAAVTITAFFRLETSQVRHGPARLLAQLFIAQNILVLFGAFRRLMLYVEVYGLTRFRTAAFLWLLLVLVGFIFITIKLAKNKPFIFLLQTNAVSTVLLLTCVTLLNLDGFIADWNVARYKVGSKNAVDVEYLGELDAGALPALAYLSQHADPEMAGAASAVLARQLTRESATQARWQAWTWRRAVAIQKAATGAK